MRDDPTVPDEPAESWDVVVVGTGMGGATAGHALARAGLRILFLEKGRGDVESRLNDGPDQNPDLRLGLGHWPDRIRIEGDGVQDLYAPLGCGPGGSTLLYAAALERFERVDFEDVAGLPHPTGGWPIGYDAFRPWYEAAETLYRVCGTRDPLGDSLGPGVRPPPPASEQDAILMGEFARAGFHPYRLHVGIAYKPGCRECLGFPCPNACKSDARTICLDPAVNGHGATLRTGCEVERLVERGGRIDTVIYRQDGRRHSVRGRVVILAAGTYRSAALLLASTSADHPRGLANGSGLVGRNLMFHGADWTAIWARRRGATHGPRKSIGFRDLYVHGGQRLASVQSMGLSAAYGNILIYLYDRFDRSPFRRLRAARPFLRIPARIAARLFGEATLFASINEDMPRPENRIELDPDNPDRIRILYRISDELKARASAARRLLRERLPRHRMYRLTQDAVSIDFGHPTGTLRFGHDPAGSVLDPDCRAHEVANLYVVDGSFMPSSGATNPGLTIAANALRVADAIRRRVDAEDSETAATDG